MAVEDYLGGLAAELGGLFSTFRYTQRGTPPSTGGPPFTVEAHVADAIAVQAQPSPVRRVGLQASIETNASLADHLQRETLVQALPSLRLPVLFVHGELDPLPVRASLETAALVQGAHVEVIAGSGHFPWLERPGEARRAIEH